MIEPTLQGAVVQTEDGRLFVRSEKPQYPDYPFCWVGRLSAADNRDQDKAGIWVWRHVEKYNPVLLFAGVKPTMKEPMLPGAIVRGLEGFLWQRVDDDVDRLSWRSYGTACFRSWEDIEDPELVYEGVSE